MSDSAQEKMAHAMQEQHAQWSAFVSKALEGSIRLVELNLKLTRQSLEESTQSMRHLLEVKSPEQLFTVDQKLMQEKLSQVMAYASEVGAIASAFSTEISQAAQSQMSDSYKKVAQFADQGVKPAVPNVFPDSMQNGYAHWMDAGKKFAESFGQSLNLPNQSAAPVKAAAPKATASRTRSR